MPNTVFFSYNVTTLYKLNILVSSFFITAKLVWKIQPTCATASLEKMGFSFPTKFLDVSLLSKLHSTEGYSSGQSKC